MSFEAGRVASNRQRGLFWGFVSGLIAAAGNILFYTAIAAPLTNVYPLVTIAIAWFWFGERLNLVQAAGILIAVAAILLLSGEVQNLGQPVVLLRRISLTPWMLYSLGAMVCWGVFSATQKFSTNHVSAEMSHLAWCAAFVPIAVGLSRWRPLTGTCPRRWSGRP